MTICPCCGFRFEGDLREGCESCGAHPVGDPLPKPERELPAYGRPLLLVLTGALMFLGLLTETIIVIVGRTPISLSLVSLLDAAETGAWRLKWVGFPFLFVVVWGSWRIYRSMRKTPHRFVGLAMARRGLVTSALVGLSFATLIGVTVPQRLRQRQLGIQAGINAQAYTIARAQLEYSALHGMVASDLLNDLKTLPDPDGSIALALANLDTSGYKTHGADVAVVKRTERSLSGAALRNASLNSGIEEPPVGELSTSYELLLPGQDKILYTDDDLILRDGIIMTVAEAKEPVKPAAATAIRSRKP